MKDCVTCKVSLPLENFRTRPTKAGYRSSCRRCETKRRSEVYHSSPEKREVKRNWRERNKARYRVYNSARHAAYRKSSPERIFRNGVRKQLENAVAQGKIQRQPCEKCGIRAQAHHEDYTKPFEVVWLCPKHHAARHREIKDDLLSAISQLKK